jgi:hypothetical protein
MNSFFKKLFGRVDKPSTDSESPLIPASKEPSVESENVTPKVEIFELPASEDKTEIFEEINSKKSDLKEPESVIHQESQTEKIYNIADINKQSTQIKNKDGFLAAISFMTSFIESNSIDFNDLVSLLKRLLTYMKKEKSLSDDYIFEYINNQFKKHLEINDVENYARIADILERVEITYAIEYLESKVNPIDTDQNKNLLYFDSLFLLSDYYLKKKQSDKAFQTLRRASLLVTNTNEKLMFVTRQLAIAEQSAKICYEGQKIPMYADYIHFQTIAFILKKSLNMLSFLLLPYLHRDKEEANLIETQHGDEDRIINSLNNLNIIKFRNQLFIEIYDYTFQKLPVNLGIPEEYLDPKFEIPDHRENRTEHRKIMDKLIDYDRTEFTELNEIHRFATTVMKKYHTLENLPNQ